MLGIDRPNMRLASTSERQMNIWHSREMIQRITGEDWLQDMTTDLISWLRPQAVMRVCKGA